MLENTLFSGGEIRANDFRRTRNQKETCYYWVTTRLLREAGPWYSPPIATPYDVVSLVNEHLDLENADREHLVVLCLDNKSQVTAAQVVSIGSLSGTVIHPREVFKTAVVTNAARIIIVHNHPSGDPEPSEEDIEVTNRLIKAGDLLGIPLLDHIIIGNKRHWSIKAGRAI